MTPPLAIDSALESGDLAGALRAWHAAYGEAADESGWERFADAGDAYARIARASGSPAEGLARARDLYLSALFRASGAGSLEGVLRVAAAFAELGDDDFVAHALRLARRLAGPDIREPRDLAPAAPARATAAVAPIARAQ